MTLNPDTRLNVQTSKDNLFEFVQGRLESGWMLLQSPGDRSKKILTGNVHTSVYVFPITPIPRSSLPDNVSVNNQSDRAQLNLNDWRVQLGDFKAYRVMVLYPGHIEPHVGMVLEKDMLTAPDDLRRQIGFLRDQAGNARLASETREDLSVQFAAAETAYLIKTGTPYGGGAR